MPLDLEQGDENLADASPSERRRAARAAARKDSESSKTPRRKPAAQSASARERVEVELASRLDRTFDRIAIALSARGDEELADVIREDKEAMGQGLVSLTRSVKFLRSPFLMVLNLVEPVLAFGRVGRILYVRYAERQSRIAIERQQQQESSSPAVPTA